MTRALPLALALAVALGASPARAQQARASDRRRGTELVLLGVLSATYGLRIGTLINQAAGRPIDDPDPATYWILPGVLTVAVPVATLLIESRFPIRRGRGISAGVGGIMGYLGAIGLVTQLAGESFPSGQSFTSPWTFVGTTVGIAGGILVGHLTDAPPADALWAGTGAVGGAALGALVCGVSECGPALGAFVLGGELGLFTAAMLLRSTVRPTEREMRLTALGAVSGTVLLGGGVMLAHLARDGRLDAAAVQRSAAFGLGGLIVGGLGFFALGRATPEPTPARSTRTALLPSLDVRPGSFGLGVTIVQ